MSDRDPRPMPSEVQRAYRDPVDLRGLLATDVYSKADRRAVLDALVRSLVAKHGDVWIENGSREVRVTTRVRSFSKNANEAIRLLCGVEEYGGSDGVLPMLAHAMQPRWAAWWDGFELRGMNDLTDWARASTLVLGLRQVSWMAAQYARSAIDRVRPQDLKVAVRVIEAAEAWARVPSEANRQAADKAASEADDAASVVAAAYAESRSYRREARAYRALRSAAYAAMPDAMDAVSAAFYAVHAYDSSKDAYGQLAALTRWLITPTLVTSASSGIGEAPSA